MLYYEQEEICMEDFYFEEFGLLCFLCSLSVADMLSVFYFKLCSSVFLVSG